MEAIHANSSSIITLPCIQNHIKALHTQASEYRDTHAALTTPTSAWHLGDSGWQILETIKKPAMTEKNLKSPSLEYSLLLLQPGM